LAHATCPSFPYTFTNGSTADASQVNGDFNAIANCFAPINAPAFTGRVGIDTTTTPIAPLDTVGTAAFGTAGANDDRVSINAGNIGINRNVGTGNIFTTAGYAYQIMHTASTTLASDYLNIRTYQPTGPVQASQALTIGANGNVAVLTTPTLLNFYVNGSAGGTGNWVGPSDVRLKKNIVPISDAMSLIRQLRAVRYQWKTSAERDVGKSMNLPVDKPQIGFIAQEVEKVVPEAVVPPQSGVPDAVYGLMEGKLVPVLVEAVKEQQAEIETLKADIAALKASKPAAH
jgi:hypothetical protein